MITPRTSYALILAATLSLTALAACGSDDDGGSTSLGPTTTVAPSTTVAPTTTIAPTTTTIAATTTTVVVTTTTMAPTTTTQLPGATLPLRFDGVGDARFGTEPDDVITYISDILGDPTSDTDWVEAGSVGCAGTEARFVTWGDLKFTFGDESNVSSGRRHFYAWSYGPPAGTAITPEGMATLLDVTIGSSVTDIQKAYPAGELIAGSATVTPSAQLSEGLVAVLTDTAPTGAVTALQGGQGCPG